MNFNNIFEELTRLYEAKEDQELFINKFGKDRFDRFNKLKSKLSNVKDNAGNKVSADITYHVKHTSEKDLDALLDRAEGKQYVANTTTEYDIEGKVIPPPANTKKLIKSTPNYDIYKVTDYTDAIDLARKKINPDEPAYGYWCIAGRYGLGKDDDSVKVSQAAQYFNEYLMSDYDNYYFCMPKDSAANKVVICASDKGPDCYCDFDAKDQELSEYEMDDECLDFEDPDNGFSPDYMVSAYNDEDDEDEAAGDREYDNLSDYFFDFEDPMKHVEEKIDNEFKNFSFNGDATVEWGGNTECAAIIHSRKSPIAIHISWTYDPAIEEIVRFEHSLIDDRTQDLLAEFDILEDFSADEFEEEIDKIYNEIRNLDLISNALDAFIKETEDKDSASSYDIQGAYGEDRIQVLIAQDTGLPNGANIDIVTMIDFEPVANIQQAPDRAIASVSTISEVAGTDNDITLYDKSIDLPVDRFTGIIKKQVAEAKAEINKYIENHND